MNAQHNVSGKQCNVCGANIDNHERFCVFCGAEVPQQSYEDRKPKTYTDLCPNCGEPKHSTKTRYCTSCGSQFFMEIELPLPESTESMELGENAIQKTTTMITRHIDKQTAAFLAIFLGTVGVHYFYMGKIGKGILCCVFCWTLVPTIIGIIDGVKLFSMTEEDFRNKLKA